MRCQFPDIFSIPIIQPQHPHSTTVSASNKQIIMKFTSILLGLAATAIAAPLSKRAVFSQSSYDDLSISGGTAGNAQQEALQKLGGLPNDLSTVEKSDLDFLNSVNQIANDAETDAFNPAIEAASGEEADALQVSTSV